jgi:hypothetical protein
MDVRSCPIVLQKYFEHFGEKLIQGQAGMRNNDSKEPALRFDSYKFLFHRARLATFATQSPESGQTSRGR